LYIAENKNTITDINIGWCMQHPTVRCNSPAGCIISAAMFTLLTKAASS